MIETLTGRREAYERSAAWRREGLRIGFVPTMGALHDGHLALVEASLAATDRTIVSIFVNPLQFAPTEDLASYPRPLERDRAALSEAGAHALFLPAVGEMYPAGSETKIVQETLPTRLCGPYRPGHFTGVLTVVMKLLLQTRPHVAFFGRKDFQQTVVIDRMVRDLDLDLELEIRIEPTHRESDGLAMSSRNVYLKPAERKKAPAVKRALDAVGSAFSAGETSAPLLESIGRSVLDEEGGFSVEYFTISDPKTLDPRQGRAFAGDVVAVAAYLGRTRLIDNGSL